MGIVMNNPSVTQQVQFDAICFRFEQAWRQDGPPSLESFLEGTADADRPLLLPQLLLVEFELLEAAGTSPKLNDYLDRFPEEHAIVQKAFDDHASALTADNSLDSIQPEGTSCHRQFAEEPGSQIGRYKLLERIGEGGMGVVYMAEQQRPVRRKVALKVIKPGMDTKQVVARFEAERQALAMMDHPNIARVLDAGSTDSGRPYFVMELVRGTTLTEYCNANKLDTNARLKLFKSVCKAVQHAHTKGIIHRDLKPSNVLVTLHDGVPVPKIIDFGVSKAMGQQLTEKTMFTAFAQMVGTPLYMSPEQAEMSGLDIDTRSDIYSLGVLLYELLTGVTPFDRQRLHTAAFDELRRIIREEEPDKPSTRVSSLGGSSATVSAQRSTDPAKLKQLLRGELDWIVMKTLEKDRNRRYETANALVAEVDRYLSGEPVNACPPSTTYRLGKLARKYKSQFAVAAGFAAMLVMSSIVAWYLYANARIARNDAVAAKDNVTVERDRAVAAEREAANNLQQATLERDRAESEKQRADRHSDELKERLYDYYLTKAVAAQRDGDLEGMQSLLADCLEDQRGWEWHRLNRLGLLTSQPLDREAQVLTSNPVKSQLAIGYLDGTVQLRDDTSGDVVWERPSGNRYVVDLAFSPSGTLLAVSHASQNLLALKGNPSPDGRGGIELWDSATGKLVWQQSLNPGYFGVIEFAPDGDRFVTFSGSNIASLAVEFRTAETGELIWSAPAPGLPVSMVFSPDGQHLYLSLWSSLYVNSSSTLACWNVENHEQLWSVKRSASSGVEITDKGTRLVTGGENHSVQIWEASTGDKVDELHAESGGRNTGSVSLHPDGSRLVSRCHGRLTIWDWKTKKELRSIGLFASGSLPFHTFCRDGRVASLDDLPGSIIQFFDPEPDKPQVLTLVGHEKVVRCLASTQNNELASVSGDGTLRSWNLRTGQETSVRTVAPSANTVAYSPDGRFIATGGSDGAKLWEADSRRLVQHWPEIGNVWWIDFDAGGERLAAGGGGKLLKLWDVADGTTLITQQTQGMIDGLEIDDDNNLLVVLGNSGSIELVNMTSGEAKELKAAPESAELKARCLCRLPGSSVVAAGMKESVELWDVKRGIQTGVLRTADTRSLLFDKDAKRLFTADRSGTVKVWNIESGAQLLDWNAHNASVYSMVLSPDGKTLVTASYDGLIKLWETERLTLEVMEERRVVGTATTKVNDLYHQSGALRDVMAALTNDESLSNNVRRFAMEIASARGDRPRGPLLEVAASADRSTAADVFRTVQQAADMLVGLVEAESGIDVDEPRVIKPSSEGGYWWFKADVLAAQFSSARIQRLVDAAD